MSDEPAIRLFSSSLLSKWGFNDGDSPDEWHDWCDERGLEFFPRLWHPVLVKLVRQYLLPALEQRVTVVQIGTNHNPIRAGTVDGADVAGCWHGDQPAPVLTPEFVRVPMSEVAKIAFSDPE